MRQVFNLNVKHSRIRTSYDKTRSKSAKRSSNLRRIKVHSLNRSSEFKFNISEIKSSITEKTKKTSLFQDNENPKLLSEVYKAKCADLNIPCLPEQEKKFLAYCSTSLKNRRLLMRSLMCGPKSGKAIGKLLSKSRDFAFVDLAKNTLGDKGVEWLCKYISKTNEVVHLDLSCNDISSQGAVCIFGNLKDSCLVSLDLSSNEGLHRNRLGTQAAKAIKDFLASNALMQTLNLEGTSLGSQGISLVIKGLSSNTNLLSINLASNEISSGLVLELVRVLPTTSIMSLNLSQNSLKNEGAEYISKYIYGNFGHFKLKKLSISKADISTQGFTRIFSALTYNPTLEYLSVSHNSFQRGLPSTFSPMLRNNYGLKVLKLGNCSISNREAFVFSEGLSSNRGLTQLDLENNFIEDEGAEKIAKGLRRNSKVKKLNLSGNRIRDKGGVALGNLLAVNRNLEEVHLKQNLIRDETGTVLMQSLRTNFSILVFDLDLNPISNRYLYFIKSYLERNRKKKHLTIVPKLKNQISTMQSEQKSMEIVQKKIRLKKKELKEGYSRLERQHERVNEVSQTEQLKTKEIVQQKETLQKKNHQLAESLAELQSQITVSAS